MLLKMAQIKSWTVSDALWSKVEPLIPVVKRMEGRRYQRKPGAGRKPMPARQVFSAIVYVLRTGIQGKAFAPGVRLGECRASVFSELAEGGVVPQVVAGRTGRIRRDAGHRLGVAKHRRGLGKSSSGTRMRGAEPHASGKKRDASEVC
jgi:hypothetical protein